MFTSVKTKDNSCLVSCGLSQQDIIYLDIMYCQVTKIHIRPSERNVVEELRTYEVVLHG